jgi:hypothetical protein
VRNAGFDGFSRNFAPVAIEQGQLAAGLFKAPRQVANLRLAGPDGRRWFACFLRNFAHIIVPN